MTGRLKQRERGRDELNDAERVYADASWRGQEDRCPSLKKTKDMASSVVRIAPHKNSIRRNAAPLTQIPPRTVSEGYQARKRTAVVSRSRAETLYEDDRRMGEVMVPVESTLAGASRCVVLLCWPKQKGTSHGALLVDRASLSGLALAFTPASKVDPVSLALASAPHDPTLSLELCHRWSLLTTATERYYCVSHLCHAKRSGSSSIGRVSGWRS